MSITRLKTLVAVADQGSFVAAADAVGVSQAAVGQQMKRLEDTLGVVLFDRSRTPPRLNALGYALVPRARDVIRGYASLLDSLPGAPGWVGELSLGAVPSTLRGLVPLSVKSWMTESPGLNIRIVPGLTSDLHEQVERGALDAAIVSQPARLGKTLTWHPVVEEELVLLISPHSEAGDPITLLSERPFIRHTRRAAVGLLVEDWLLSRQVNVHTSMEMESIESIASMVFHGLGVSIVPDLSVPDLIFARLKKISLGSPTTTRALGVICRTDSPNGLLIERLLEEIGSTIDEHRETTEEKL